MSVRQDEQNLERHAIGLPAVTAQSAALIGPAAGSVAGLAFIVGYSGAATPLVRRDSAMRSPGRNRPSGAAAAGIASCTCGIP